MLSILSSQNKGLACFPLPKMTQKILFLPKYAMKKYQNIEIKLSHVLGCFATGAVGACAAASEHNEELADDQVCDTFIL